VAVVHGTVVGRFSVAKIVSRHFGF